MEKKDFKKIKLPNKSGVYLFKKGKEILYIGKATYLQNRVKSYFSKDLVSMRSPFILDMVFRADNILFETTDSVLEALILEANLIKKYQPKYNTKEKDNKSFNYVCITKEELPKVIIVRGRNISFQQYPNSSRFTQSTGAYTDKNLNIPEKKYQSIFGPFTNGSQLREAMRIVRRIFPYIDEQSSKKNNKVFYKQLGLVPSQEVEPLTGRGFSSKASLDYKNNIKNLKLFFQGKKKSILINLKKEMFAFANKKEFEKAGEIKKRIFALNHINDVALIKGDRFLPPLTKGRTEEGFLINQVHLSPALSLVRRERNKIRIEAYDIAHLFGKNMVGVMTVIENGELAKNEYKKFIIRTQDKANDTGALLEVLSRRMRHTEWGLPDIIVMDGGIAQMNVAKSILDRYQFKIPVVSVVKDDKHKAKAIMGDEKIIKKYKKEILLVNNESHRFAITFHKKRRDKNFLIYGVPYNNGVRT